ncbi:MAG: hypothetical protein WC628_02005 [Candidatus Omnitrophota bacterium]
MPRKIAYILCLAVFFSGALFIPHSFAGSEAAVEFLTEFGVTFYRQGKYNDALTEFNKVLLLDPNNPTAKKYINAIFEKENPQVSPEINSTSQPSRQEKSKSFPEAKKPVSKNLEKQAQKQPEKPAEKLPVKETQKLPEKKLSRDEEMNLALRRSVPEASQAQDENSPGQEDKLVILSGEYRVAMGITSSDFIWKDANADKVGVPREKNWRYLWGDQRENTYDRKIFDRLTVGLDTNFDSPFNGYVEATADPWTFVGKNHVTVNSGSDSVDMDLKYWSADGRVINESYRSRLAKIITLNPVKVVDGKISSFLLKNAVANTSFGSSVTPVDLKRDYRPLRKMWLDYTQGDMALKVFPISDEFEALSSDDPLKISNNHVYWEESPWLDQYEESRIFESAGFPIKEGRWIHSLSSFTKDSSDDYPHRLTFLRGASIKFNPGNYSFEATAAAPMTLWDEYQSAKSVEAAARLKIPISDFKLGFTSATKVGMRGDTREALNQTQAFDLKYDFSKTNRLYGEIAKSFTNVKEANEYKRHYSGLGTKIGFKYDEASNKNNGIYRSNIYLASMDDDFEPGLSNYRYTRNDEPTLSRHVYFGKLREMDEKLIWGDGIDRNRQVLGLGLGFKAFEEKLDTDINYRTVRNFTGNYFKGKYVESVLRAEAEYKISPRLTSKVLGYYMNLPETRGGFDPLLYDKTMYSLTDYFSGDDDHPKNADVEGGKDPSIGSFGGGLKYDLVENLVSLEGVYERTNDPQSFPRGLLNNLEVTKEVSDEQLWDKVLVNLYDQDFFGLPPYDYYSIAKTRLILTPASEWEVILSYVYNEDKHATGIDDNINHVAFETTYKPTGKLTFWFKYVYSRVIDVYKQNQYQSDDFFDSHHNLFFASEYKLGKDDSFTLLYGEFVGYKDPLQQSYWTLSTLDTQHIFRLFYKRKF